MNSENLDKWVKEITDKRMLTHSSIEELYVDVSTTPFTISSKASGVVDKKEFGTHRARMNYFLFILNIFLQRVDDILHTNEQSDENSRITVNTAWSPITTNQARIKELYDDFIDGKIYKSSKYKHIVDFVYNVLLIFKKELDMEEKSRQQIEKITDDAKKSKQKEKVSTLFPEEWRNETNKDMIMTNFIIPLVSRLSYIEDIRKDKSKNAVKAFLHTVKEYMSETKTAFKITPFYTQFVRKQGGYFWSGSFNTPSSPTNFSCSCSSRNSSILSNLPRQNSFYSSGSGSGRSPSIYDWFRGKNSKLLPKN